MVRRSQNLAQDVKSLPAIVNNGYFSDYFLAYRLDAGLTDLYKRWDVREREGIPTARTSMRSLGNAFDKFRVDAALTSPETRDGEARLDLKILPVDGVAALRDLNDAVFTALEWIPARDQIVTLTSGDKVIRVPVAFRCDTPTGLLLLAVDAVFATDPATVVADKTAAPGTLLDPVLVGDKPAGRTVLEAAQLIFTADDPPNYLLVSSGGSIMLLDRDRWGEGVYLAVNLDDAVARNDARSRGELAAIAALFSAGVINPGKEAQSVLANLLDRAANESAGVSQELRHGVRRSVEQLANAVVRDVRYRQKGAWRQIDPDVLTRECLRYLYRIIVLLFAEARPELGILPVDDPDYQAGYSLARLRDVALTELHGDQALSSAHIQQSLAVLFRAVNEGYEPDAVLDLDSSGLSFPGLGSALFDEDACPLLDRSRITDEDLQKVLANLCFTPEQTGRSRQSLSYAALGINQLGAIYEGLMAYKGFLATEELFEIDNDGDPDNGSWVIPVNRADEFPDGVFLTEEGSDGQKRRIRYQEGDFVFRLSGRDRKRSASYYTPEVLTEFTVRHALEVFFEENSGLQAAEILRLTICEPALGSGAFLNEAINQLAARYLKAAQNEAAVSLDADKYQAEFQKVKAHFAVNQAFGVDLNQTAVELAEVSLWLNCMHHGLRAPWFGARLRRGNSLVGCRRATYTLEEVRRAVWVGKSPVPPADQNLDRVAFEHVVGIHHFLLPGTGWGSAADAAEIRELEPEWSLRVKEWRRKLSAKPTRRQVERLVSLAAHVEQLWRESTKELRRFWELTRQHVEVWGSPEAPTGDRFGDASARRILYDARSATARLRTLMDAWCSLWLWAPQHGSGLPTLDDWLAAAEALLRINEPWQTGVLFRDESELDLGRIASLEEVVSAHPWLQHCAAIAHQQGWFHWELEFSPVFERGGFDLVVGNPPWTKVSRTDTDVLLDAEPAWAINGVPRDAAELDAGRAGVLARPGVREDLLAEAALSEGLAHLLGSRTRYPATWATLTNLYLCFIEQAFRLSGGVTGLLHQESFYEDAKAAQLRTEVLLRLRRHWHFVNELSLFADVHNETEFGVHICSAPLAEPHHLYAANLLHPATADRSLDRWRRGDASGELPGKKTDDGEWDLRPHATRILTVDSHALKAFAMAEGLAFDMNDPPRPLRLYAEVELRALEALEVLSRRVRDLNVRFSSGIHESSMAKPGKGQLIKKEVAVPSDLRRLVLKGPNINVANPCYQEANESYGHSKDNAIIDLTAVSATFLPRTVLQVATDPSSISARLASKDRWDSVANWRQMWPEHVSRGWVRMFQPALIPPGVLHGHSCMSAAFGTVRDLVRVCGLSSSVVYELLLRMLGTDHLGVPELSGLPYPADRYHPAWPLVEARVLRLNAVTDHYRNVWGELFDERWISDAPTLVDDRAPRYEELRSNWSWDSPIRDEMGRWLTLVELDALAALLLGVPADLVQTIGKLHLGLLSRYDSATLFDGTGAKISGEFHNRGARQTATSQYALAVEVAAGVRRLEGEPDLAGFVLPFTKLDRWDLFTNSYRVFVDRLGLGSSSSTKGAE